MISRIYSASCTPRFCRERLGFVFQSFNLLARTSALENVGLPLYYATSGPLRRAARTERTHAARFVGLEERERNTLGQLSGGQRQRVAIARAFGYRAHARDRPAHGDRRALDMPSRKRLFADHLLRSIPLAAHIRHILDERPGHAAPRSRFLAEREDHLSTEDAERTLSAVIGWGRFAECFAYDHPTRMFSLENPQ